MTISKEIKEYFSQLLEPLAKNDSILSMLNKFKEEVLAKVTEQAKRIDELEGLIAVKENVIQKLTYNCNNNEKQVAELKINCDNNEQYSRRSCVRIHGKKFDEKTAKEEDIYKIVENCYTTMGLQFNKDAIDRAHRIGKVIIDAESGVKSKSIIVKFKSWSDRTAFYKNRPKRYVNGEKKPGAADFSVSLDLTKRRYDLLKSVQRVVKNYSDICYAFCDVNCSLGLKLTNGKLVFFNDEDQFQDCLSYFN